MAGYRHDQAPAFVAVSASIYAWARVEVETMATDPKSKDDDIRKLRAYRRELGYLHALFVRFGVREQAGTICECEWVDV
jgi:hypothetical protein